MCSLIATFACPEFSFTAWVEVVSDPSNVDRIPILRKPMRTDKSLTCWGWFHAPEFRFGAHGEDCYVVMILYSIVFYCRRTLRRRLTRAWGADFHSLDPKEVEASVSAGLALEKGLTHEVLVSKGGNFTFYRNGAMVASVPTPRAITDCAGDAVMLGDSAVALASVSFYGRALAANEIAEMYVGGQPLSELATGSVLPQSEFDSTEQVMATVQSSGESVEQTVGEARDQTIHNTVLSMAASTVPVAENTVLHPPDNAGVKSEFDPRSLARTSRARSHLPWDEPCTLTVWSVIWVCVDRWHCAPHCCIGRFAA